MFKFLISTQGYLIVRLLFWTTLTTGVFSCSMSREASASISLKQNNILVRKLSNTEQSNLVEEIHRQINQYRSSLNLTPLNLNLQVSQIAATHSRDMAQQTVKFSHQGFETRIQRIKNDISYRSAAENIAYNQGYSDPASQAVAGWIKSKGHRQNIEGNYNLTGIGVAKNHQGEYYFTQIFILKN